ncbi:MAG: hypothetical protein RLZZ129_49 [Verrucomicrobiota bacterium]|jgi:hypothetical protein
MNLDLENPTAFWPVIRENKKGHSEVLELCRKDVLLVSSLSACGDLPKRLEETTNSFVRSAKERVEAITAYHGCRVFSESDYRGKGIRRLETNRIVSWSKEFFGHDARIDEIIMQLGHDYVRHGESGVYCMRAIEAAKRNGCRHSEGSEIVRCIAKRLGRVEEERYFSVGRPCFIEVRVPKSWFELNAEPTVEVLLRNVFVHWLWVELNLDWPGDPREGGIVFRADIPSDYVKAFHYTG